MLGGWNGMLFHNTSIANTIKIVLDGGIVHTVSNNGHLEFYVKHLISNYA